MLLALPTNIRQLLQHCTIFYDLKKFCRTGHWQHHLRAAAVFAITELVWKIFCFFTVSLGLYSKSFYGRNLCCNVLSYWICHGESIQPVRASLLDLSQTLDYGGSD